MNIRKGILQLLYEIHLEFLSNEVCLQNTRSYFKAKRWKPM